MKVYILLFAILLIRTKSVLSQNPTCAVYDFNDPLILNDFQDCSVLTAMVGSKPLITQSYDDSTLPPFRPTSQNFLTTNKSVNNDIVQCLCTKALFSGNFSSFSFKIGINLRSNDVYNNVQFFVSNLLAFQIDAGVNGWKLYEKDFSSPSYGTFDDSLIGIKARIGSSSELAIEYVKFYDPLVTNENCVPLTISTTSPETTTDTPVTEITETETSETETTETETSQTETPETETPETDLPETDYPETETPPNKNPSCLKVDFNNSISLPNSFRECYEQYLPVLIVKSYLDTTITPFHDSSMYYMSNRWEGLSCIETTSVFSLKESSIIESAIYLNGLGPGAWIEIFIVDVGTGERAVLKTMQTASEWRLLSEEVKRKFSNAQIVIMTNMNSYSQLAMEYFNISDGTSCLPDS